MLIVQREDTAMSFQIAASPLRPLFPSSLSDLKSIFSLLLSARGCATSRAATRGATSAEGRENKSWAWEEGRGLLQWAQGHWCGSTLSQG